MSFDTFLDLLLDSLVDALIVFGLVFLIHVLISFFETKLAKLLEKGKRTSPFFGSLFGLIPQCGVSVLASDLYLKEHITTGTLIAVFLSCSDEAIPLMIASHNEKSLYAFVLLGLKFVIGFVVGFLADLLLRDKKEVDDHLHHCHHEEEIHLGCCHHEIDDEKENPWHKHLVHPLLHSLKIFAYVLIINLAFGLLLELIGKDNVMSFLTANAYLAPLFSSVIGIIPNCASSILITELYLDGGISFGACLAGLLMNAGLGLFYLFRNKEGRRKAWIIILICFASSLAFGYLTCAITGF